MSEQTIAASYDPRFGLIVLQVQEDGKEIATMRVLLKNFVEALNIRPYELKAILEQAEYVWHPDKDCDVEPARRRLLEQTDWKGKVVLDVGGYDGFAAEIAHKGGAVRAICLDNQQYDHYGWETKRKPGVEYVTGDMMDYYVTGTDDIYIDNGAEDTVVLPRPDVIILYNVLYHVKNPWLFLEKARELVKPGGEMLLCTLFRYHEGSWVYLYEGRECNPTDESVFWGPSIEALERLLRFTGWEAEQYALAYDRVVYRCKPVEPQSRQARW